MDAETQNQMKWEGRITGIIKMYQPYPDEIIIIEGNAGKEIRIEVSLLNERKCLEHEPHCITTEKQ